MASVVLSPLMSCTQWLAHSALCGLDVVTWRWCLETDRVPSRGNSVEITAERVRCTPLNLAHCVCVLDEVMFCGVCLGCDRVRFVAQAQDEIRHSGVAVMMLWCVSWP